jgi:uncharacterized membrane protein YfcA
MVFIKILTEVLSMFGGNSDLIPKTFSVKSYRRRKTFNFKKFLIYLTFSIIIIAALGVTLLSISHLI